MSQSQPRAAIIGAGVCGLNCARHLNQRGWQVDVYDKGRGIGGRLAVKRIDGLGSVDLGAQFMTALTPEFISLLKAEEKLGRVTQWDARIAYIHSKASEQASSQIRWIGTPAMNTWLESVWPRTQIKFNQQIDKISRGSDGRWILDGTNTASYDCVILAMPPKQAANLAGGTPLEEALRAVPMTPCWAALALFDEPLPVDIDAAFIRIGGLDWIAANHTKPGRTLHPAAWTLHAGADLSSELLEKNHEQVAPRLLSALGEALGTKLPNGHIHLTHRWRYAAPTTTQPTGVMWSPDLGLGAGGDWAVGGRVEGAFTAGRLLAEAVVAASRPFPADKA